MWNQWETTDLPQVNNKRYHIGLYQINYMWNQWETTDLPQVNNKRYHIGLYQILLNIVLNDTNNFSVVFLLYIFVLVNMTYIKKYKNTPIQSLL
jgi:hypothetical protein